MKASEIMKSIVTLYMAGQPAFIWGGSGVGKSSVMNQAIDVIAKETGKPVNLWDLRVGYMDMVEFRGLPYLRDNITFWARPSFLPTEGQGILFLDEMNVAPPSIQAMCYQLMLEKRVGEHILPPKVMPFAAGNREEDKGIVHKMPMPLANRLVHLDFDVDLEEWVAWAIDNNVLTEVIGFVRFRPELLHKFDPGTKDRTFPSPRSWHMLSNVMQVVGKGQWRSESFYQMITGTVGTGAGTEFWQYIELLQELPNPDLVIMNPTSTPVPKKQSVLHALCAALAKKASEQTFDAIATYANRLSDEFSVVLVRDCVRRNGKVVNTRAFIEWSTKHSSVLI